MLAHELAHVRQRDYAVALLAATCRAVHFTTRSWAGWQVDCGCTRNWRLTPLPPPRSRAGDVSRGAGSDGPASGPRIRGRDGRPFLSDRNSLLRRVGMLRVMDDRRPIGRAGRGFWPERFAARPCRLLDRGTAQAPPAAVAEQAADVSYIPAGSQRRGGAPPGGPVHATRVEAGSRPVETPQSRRAGAARPREAIALRLRTDRTGLRTVHLKEISRTIVGPTNDHRFSLVMGISMIRMTNDFDGCRVRSGPGERGDGDRDVRHN